MLNEINGIVRRYLWVKAGVKGGSVSLLLGGEAVLVGGEHVRSSHLGQKTMCYEP